MRLFDRFDEEKIILDELANDSLNQRREAASLESHTGDGCGSRRRSVTSDRLTAQRKLWHAPPLCLPPLYESYRGVRPPAVCAGRVRRVS